MGNRKGLVVVALLIVACAAKQKAATTTPEVPFDRQASDGQAALLGRGGAGAAAGGVEATSLLGSPDAEAIARIVKVRVRRVLRQALRDALEDIGGVSTRTATELSAALEPLLLASGDVEARSQAFIGLLVRNGLAYGIARRILVAPRAPCADLHLRATAVYEALATSPRLRALGFHAASGKVPAGCDKLAGFVARLVDLTSAVGTSLDAVTALRTSLADTATKCPAEVGQQLGIELRTGLAALASLDTVTLGDLVELGEAFRAGASQFDRDASLLREQTDACYVALRAAARRLDALALESLPARGTLAELDKAVRAVTTESTAFSAHPDALVRDLAPLLAVVHGLVAQRALHRGDVVALVDGLQGMQDGMSPGLARSIVGDLLEAAPQIVREDTAAKGGMRVDLAAASSIAVTRLSEPRSRLHLHASIGAGYLATGDLAEPAAYEELGAGFRILETARLRLSVHAIASGLLYQVQSSAVTDGAAFVGGGVSARFYGLVDFSASWGNLVELDGEDGRWVGLVGLQIPIIDYLIELASGAEVSADASASP